MATTDSPGEDVRVAVLGTGIMGSAMARNLVSAGLRTTVWDRSPAATAPLSDAGALVTASPAEAARDAHVVITMLPTADVVNSVIFAGGVAQALADGAVWAQMGTIGLAATTAIGSRLGQLRPGVLFVDAPVSGSKGPAKAGQLLILASGPPAAAAAVRPVFSAIGRKTVWLGEAGQGSRMKLVVNAYMSILIQGVAEALELAGRLGVDDAELAEAIEGGPLDAPIADAKLHKMERGDFAPEFPLEWALKDVDLAISRWSISANTKGRPSSPGHRWPKAGSTRRPSPRRHRPTPPRHGRTGRPGLAARNIRHHPPIPGTSRRAHLEENLAAARLQLSPEEMAELSGPLKRAASNPAKMARSTETTSCPTSRSTWHNPCSRTDRLATITETGQTPPPYASLDSQLSRVSERSSVPIKIAQPCGRGLCRLPPGRRR